MTQDRYEEILNRVLKAYGKKRPDIAPRVVDKNIDRIIKTYAEAYKEVYAFLVDAVADIGTSTNVTAQASILVQLEDKLKQLNSKVAEELNNSLAEAYIEGQAMHAVATETVKTIEELMVAVPYSLLNHEKILQASSDTFEDLLFVTQHTTKESKKVIREIVAKHIQLGVATNQGHREIMNRIKKELSRENLKRLIAEKALVGIIDAKGRRWKLKTYIELVVKTKLQHLHVEGLKDHALEDGYDLARIPSKGATDACRNFEGMIISLNGLEKEFPSYESLKATGLIFHPNCRHTPVPIAEFDLLHEDDKKLHKKLLSNLKNI